MATIKTIIHYTAYPDSPEATKYSKKLAVFKHRKVENYIFMFLGVLFFFGLLAVLANQNGMRTLHNILFLIGLITGSIVPIIVSKKVEVYYIQKRDEALMRDTKNVSK